MNLNLRGLRLGSKLSLLVTLVVVLAVLALGVNFEVILRQSFLDNTRNQMLHAFQRLDFSLAQIESDLKAGVHLASDEESSIASIDLINQYQDKAHYNTALIDEEKKSLAKNALDRVKFSQSQDMAIYDQNNELLAFANRQLGVYHLGYMSFASGHPQTLIRAESSREFLPSPTPLDNLLDDQHVARVSSEKTSQEPLISYQRMDDKVVIKSHQNTFDPVSHRYVGHFEFSYVLDQDYFMRLSKDLGVELTQAFASPLAAQSMELQPHALKSMLNVTESPGQYLAVMRKNTLAGPVYFTVTTDKSNENELINSQRRQIFLTLLAIGGCMLIFMRHVFNRSLVQPLKQLMQQIYQIKHGNYVVLPAPNTGDELEEVGHSVNALASTLLRRETELSKSEQKTRTLASSLHEAQEISQLGSWTLDLPSAQLHWSAQIYRLFELNPQHFEPSYDTFLDAIHPDDRASVNQAYTASLANRSDYKIEHRLSMADGRIKWVSERCHTEFDPDGLPLRSIGTVQDITERKLAELALADAHSLLMTVIDSIPMRVFWKDHQHNYLGCNSAFAHDAGKTAPADLIGKDDYQMGWAAQAELYRADDRQVMDSGVVRLFYDEPQTTPQGQEIWLRTSKIPLKNQAGQIFGLLGVYEDISQRKQAEELVRKLSQVAEQSPESVVIANLDATIEYVNLAFERNTGYCRAEVIGKTPRILHTPQTPQSTVVAMWQALKQGQTWSGELFNRRKDGSLYTDWAVISPLRDENGVVTHYVAIQEDITVKKRLADELDQHRHTLEQLVELRTAELTSARQQAELASRAKSEFLANMSHEIRTPMNGVIGMADILAQTSLTSEQKRMLGTINTSSLALLSILNDILDFSKIEAGKLDIEQIATPLREVVESAAQLMLNTARNKDVEISLFVDPSLPEWIVCDPTRLRQILLNLLGNALKFVSHRSGHAMLHVQSGTRLDGSACLHLSVIDNGIGMSPEVLAKLFQPFTQADASTMRRFGGTGLGLSITQRLVTMLHGSISVQSALGMGSEFTVELPLQATTPPEGHTTRAMPDLNGINVLVVSPSMACLTLFQTYLGSVGARVIVLPDLATAHANLTQATKNTVLLLDQTQAEGVDQSVQGSLTQDLDNRVVCLVRRRTSGNESHVIEVQARPLLYQDLLQGVALACHRISIKELAASTSPTSGSQPVAPSIEEAARTGQLILLAEDNETNREVMHEQLRLLGYACEVAVDGAQALTLWREGLSEPQPRYALLLTDCHMPNLDGFELTEAIRQSEPNGTHLPIIAITANAMQGEAERCNARGMDGYLCKPLLMRELGDMLNKWLPLKVRVDPLLINPESPAGARNASLPTWNPDTLTRLIGHNPALHERLLQKFMTNADKQCSQIETAMTAGDLETIKQVSHTLKSAARSVGALAVGELCQGLEDAGHHQDEAACRALAQNLSTALAGAVQQITMHLAS